MPEFSLFNTRIHDHGHAYSYDTFMVSRRRWQTHGNPSRDAAAQPSRSRRAWPCASFQSVRPLDMRPQTTDDAADGEVKFNTLAVICHVSVPHAHQFGNSIPFPARPSQHRFIRGLSPGVSQRLFSRQRLFKKTLRARGVCRIYLTYTLKRPRYLEDARSILVGSVSYFARREQSARRFLGSVPAIPALSPRPSGSAAARSSG